MATSVIRKYVQKNLTKATDEGIMVIPTSQKVDFQESIIKELLIKKGIDPDLIKNENQLNEALAFIKQGEKITPPATSENVIDITDKMPSPFKNIETAKKKGDFRGIFNQVMKDPEIAREFMLSKKFPFDPVKNVRSGEDAIPLARAAKFDEEMKKLNVSATPGKDAKGTVGEFVNQMKKFNVSDKDIQMMLGSGKSGQVDYVMEQYGMSASDVVDALKRGEPLIEGMAKGGRIGFQGGGKDASKDDFGGGFNTGQGGGAQFSGSGGDISPGTDLGGGFRSGGGDGPPGNKDNNPIKDIAKKVAINQISKKLGFAKFANPIGQLMAIKGIYDSIKNPMGTPNQFGIGDLFGNQDEELESKKESGPESVSLGTGLAEQAKQAVIDRQAQIEEAAKALGYADGGRIGYKDGMDRRSFLKIIGGLATLPIFGKFFKGAKTVKAVDKAKDVTNIVSQPPSYFFTLADKIKKLGKESKVKPQERMNEYSYVGKNGDEYTLTEDIGTGDMQIVKDKTGIGTYNEKSFDTINDRTVMEYKKGRGDETTKGTPPDEYDEYKVEFDQDGTMAGADNISEITKKEIVDEVSDNIPSIKKASGGIARMLGE